MNVFPVVLGLAIAAACAAVAWAEPATLKGGEIRTLLTDHSLYGGQAGEVEQIFQKSGATFFMQGGATSQGTWSISGDQYCSVWPPNPANVCYRVEQEGQTVRFVGPSGKISAMRTVK